VRNLSLHDALAAFTSDAGSRLKRAAADGDEIPFEVIESDVPRGRIPLYCYRPLTGQFIRDRLGLLVALPSYAATARALESAGGVEVYLRAQGEAELPEQPRACADMALRCFLARVFAERSEFDFDGQRFERAYAELERALYQGRRMTEVVAPLLGIDLDPSTDELVIGDGLSLVRPGALVQPPAELRPAAGPPALLVVLRIAHDRLEQPSGAFARTRFRRLLTALRLYEPGSYAIGPMGFSRIDGGVWTAVPLGDSGRPRRLTLVPAAAEDELRGFCNLISRRLPGRTGTATPGGEVAWALRRFEMGADRATAFEALTDYLLALRALLEPEGPGSGRLAQRIAVICAPAHARAALAERTAHAVALEHAVITGLTPSDHPNAAGEELIDELAENLRAILRDVLCGHLNADVCAVADDLLAEAAAAAEEAAAV
jgi:hypothetical protein